ncbi:hypothetical protein HY493_00425 [Candidatus Woesearchaeota archaeon]|nr:hypothetical protein [Candidatus Woesearchaeota archaeon]
MSNEAFDAAYRSYLGLEPSLKSDPELAHLGETVRITLSLRDPVQGLTLVRLCDVITEKGVNMGKVREDVLSYLQNEARVTYDKIAELLKSERIAAENNKIRENEPVKP